MVNQRVFSTLSLLRESRARYYLTKLFWVLLCEGLKVAQS